MADKDNPFGDYDVSLFDTPYWQRQNSQHLPIGQRESKNLIDGRGWRPGGFFAMDKLPVYEPPPETGAIDSNLDAMMNAMARSAPPAEPMHMPPIMDFFRRPSQPNDPTAPPLNALARFMMMRR